MMMISPERHLVSYYTSFFSFFRIMFILLKQHLFLIYFSVLLVCLLLHPCLSNQQHRHHQFGSSLCSVNEFILDGMISCHPLLTCQDAANMKPIRLLASGVVKNIWLVQWHQWQIVMAKLTNPDLREDFAANLQNLLHFKGNRHVSNLIGYCGNTTIFSQHYPLGNALNLHALFARTGIASFADRFQFCINYVQIISLLHQHSMVMCDSNSVAKTLTQYLITDQFELVLNDLDALPRLRHNVTKCGHRQVYGDLMAPEQEWPFPELPFDDSRMPAYTEKVDIWKIADICHWMLGDAAIVPTLTRNLLHHIHSRCKQTDPKERPTATDVLYFYNLINQLI